MTEARRANILKHTDPAYTYLLDEPKAFDAADPEFLFGRKFLKRMVKEVEDNATLRSMRPSGGGSSHRQGTGQHQQSLRRSGYRGRGGNRGNASYQHSNRSAYRYVSPILTFPIESGAEWPLSLAIGIE